MLKHLHQKNEHIKDMLTDKDITFIGEMINGPEDGQPYKGTNKTFLYEVCAFNECFHFFAHLLGQNI